MEKRRFYRTVWQKQTFAIHGVIIFMAAQVGGWHQKTENAAGRTKKEVKL
ncbi:hypothetical protein [Cronobacter dublinensis]|nr:hypothetical protein [Cronobacter dublinensis]